VREAGATLFGVGHLRPAPGTWASAVACLVAAGLLWLVGPWVFLILLVLLVPLASAAAAAEVEASGDADPSHVVIDEVVGQWIALLPVGFGAWAAGAPVFALWPGWIAAFLLFRLLDVWKPWIIGRADARGDVAGLMLDDILAGAFAALGIIVLAAIAHLPVLL
jgi:phosphatidylglycerophosphatase A